VKNAMQVIFVSLVLPQVRQLKIFAQQERLAKKLLQVTLKILELHQP
jgi:hypothetical protein